ncbi:hypothetical protein K3757_18805 (plasmid) [Sulfitobacter sp. S223]|uniref:hypothetical protein n=1 Tax=Sulfitobacter sp. S223 TaxID=2867023 RepID=UPI0021A2AA7E|nr:hypothetical protein [Sulfitobacter sp. S223]UWR28365.1 hypothetical protein K3757_18805 [Sulfitobacter sp. S223]
MTKIYILGTSNSVLGVKGYAEALGLQHEVTNRSSGRNSLIYHIGHILENRAEIESHDLLIIDHYVNDANFYCGFFGDQYPQYLEMLYQLLATLNLPVLNLMFPCISHDYPEVCDQVREISAQYGITVLDLNEAGFRPEHFRDPVHLNRYASYMMGLFLLQSLARGIGPRPAGGMLRSYPLRVISAQEFTPDLPLHSLENSVSRIRYVQLDGERTLPLEQGEKVISIGYFRDPKESLLQGFMLDGKPYGVLAKDFGSFQEMTSMPLGVQTSIAPLVGPCERVQVLARKVYISGDFTQSCITNLVVQNSAVTFSGDFANHTVFDVTMDGLVSAVDASASKAQAVPSKTPVVTPKVHPETIDFLRDTALSQDSTELDRAVDLMELAHFYRPKGAFIANKLEELRSKRAKVASKQT